MEGRNTIKLNEATVKLAIEFWLNEEVFCNNVQVMSVVAQNQYGSASGAELEVCVQPFLLSTN